MRRKRPAFITALAIALMFFGMGFLLFPFVSYSQETLNKVASGFGITAFLVRHFGAPALRIEGTLMFLAAGILGIGLWRMRRWARHGLIWYSALILSFEIAAILEYAFTTGMPRSLDSTGLILFGGILAYICRPKVRLAFESDCEG